MSNENIHVTGDNHALCRVSQLMPLFSATGTESIPMGHLTCSVPSKKGVSVTFQEQF